MLTLFKLWDWIGGGGKKNHTGSYWEASPLGSLKAFLWVFKPFWSLGIKGALLSLGGKIKFINFYDRILNDLFGEVVF